MTVTKSNFVIDENRVLDSNEEAVNRRQRDSIVAEKNERLRRSIYERLNSNSSMPDLVNDSQPGTYERKIEEPILVIQKGVESELDETAHYQIVDEMQHLKSVESIPVIVKESPVNETSPKISGINSQKDKNDKTIQNDKESDNFQNKIPPRPPARRRSRGSSLTPSEGKEEKKEVQEVQKIPPVVKPRKRNHILTIQINEILKENEDPHLNEVMMAPVASEAQVAPVVPKKNEDFTSDISTITPKENENSTLNIDEQTEDSTLNPPPEQNVDQSSSNTISNEQSEDVFTNIITIPSKQDKDSHLNVSAITLIQNEESIKIVTPKSILKRQQDTSQQSKSSVQFINVPDISSSSSEDEDYDDKNDVWSKIDLHRKQLMMDHEFNRVYISSSPSDSPPPLPKTPPPTADIQEKNFQFA